MSIDLQISPSRGGPLTLGATRVSNGPSLRPTASAGCTSTQTYNTRTDRPPTCRTVTSSQSVSFMLLWQPSEWMYCIHLAVIVCFLFSENKCDNDDDEPARHRRYFWRGCVIKTLQLAGCFALYLRSISNNCSTHWSSARFLQHSCFTRSHAV